MMKFLERDERRALKFETYIRGFEQPVLTTHGGTFLNSINSEENITSNTKKNR